MLYTYTGAAYYDEENKFNKIDFDEIKDQNFLYQTKSSWISMLEHYFFLPGYLKIMIHPSLFIPEMYLIVFPINI